MICGMCIYMFLVTESMHNHEIRPISGLSWSDFRNDVGYNVYVKNPTKTLIKFDRKYYGKGVSWEGYVIRVNLNDEDSLNFAYHSATIMLKMDPPEQENSQGADLGLSLSERVLKELKFEID